MSAPFGPFAVRTHYRKAIAALLAALLLAAALVQPARAAPPAPAVEFGCQGGVCQFQLNLGPTADLQPSGVAVWLKFLEMGLRPLPGGARLQVQEDVTFSLPLGTFVLPDADLVLEFGDGGKIASIHGTTALPMPTLGLFDTFQWVTPARITVAYDVGAALPAVDAPIAADHHYLYFDVEAGLHAIMPEGVELTAPAGQQATLLVDVTQPVIYIDGDVHLRYMSGLAFVRELVAPAGGFDWLPPGIGLPQQIDLSVNGAVGRGVAPSLEMSADYRLEAGMVGQWLRLEEPLLEASGQVVLTRDGLLLAGQAQSVLAPATWGDGRLIAEVYIPFAHVQEPYAQLDTAQAAPDGIPNQDSEAPLHKPAATAPESETEPELASTPATGGQDWLPSAETVVEAAQTGYARIATGASQGYQWMEHGLASGWRLTTGQFCAVAGAVTGSVLGRCPAPLADKVQDGGQDEAQIARAGTQ
ncbi:MAG TPA: hypothetical protein VNK95_24255 [Caldilineaceae bacterium]|nr:hypothetical protein [Caldilineaceae bacterium]